eukprot:TRINITY_DN888_c0_g1_i12.p1 TRINITY_DN888_c0_g1~~TRINITY_DN888_c0_g1_i12.p1  ORF type:complete len:457 (+),score=56.98 TRINITY_DN888_c0_g1_i12:863-2233(+)
MLLLNLCYEKETGEPKSGYFVPAVFYNAQAAEDKRPLEWRQPAHSNSIFAGRRLQPDDSKRTFLTDGFFPLVQVELHNYARKEWCSPPDNADTCKLDKNLFTILVNGIEVIVEYSSSRYSVDILVKSSKPHKETMEFVQAHFIHTIRQVCASQEGCPGVSLCEMIIRPECCGAGRTSPVLCAYRRTDQVIAVSELERRANEYPDYEHSWVEVVDENGKVVVPAGNDSAARLLGEEDHPSTATASDSVMRDDRADSHRQPIFITSEDVSTWRKLASWAWMSKVVPLRLHLKCGCRDGEHEVEQQPGRTFYLVDNDIQHALEESMRRGVIVFLASALNMVPSLGGMGSALRGLPLKDGTPIYRDSMESLSKRIIGEASKLVTVEEWRSLVEEDMQKSLTGGWMKAFLHSDSSVEADNAFKRDFMLTQVQYQMSSSTRPSAWICDDHLAQNPELLRRYL